MHSTDHIARTKRWLEDWVIQLNLCPFASHPYKNAKVKFRLCKERTAEGLGGDFLQEIAFLESSEGQQIDTSIIILSNLADSFEEYLDLYYWLEEIVELKGWEDKFQLASFHPNYQFDGTQVDDPENYTNRSPFPLIHILRSEQVEKAILHHPDTEDIPNQNIKTMNDLGLENIKIKWNEF